MDSTLVLTQQVPANSNSTQRRVASAPVLQKLISRPLVAAGLEPEPLKSNESHLRPLWQAVPVVRFADDLPGRWHAKGGQDQLIFALLGGKKAGFFVDLAANHPVFVSNTRTLERDYGWKGLCIEANPRYWALLRSSRDCKVVGAAVADKARTVTFVDQRKGGFGGIADVNTHARVARKTGLVLSEFQTQTLPFDRLLLDMGAPPTIDYISLDVEGAETLVMSSFPFNTRTIAVLTVEEPKAQLAQKLVEHRYAPLCWLGSDQVWVHNSTVLADVIRLISVCSGSRRCEPLLSQTTGRTEEVVPLRAWDCSMLRGRPKGKG